MGQMARRKMLDNIDQTLDKWNYLVSGSLLFIKVHLAGIIGTDAFHDLEPWGLISTLKGPWVCKFIAL